LSIFFYKKTNFYQKTHITLRNGKIQEQLQAIKKSSASKIKRFPSQSLETREGAAQGAYCALSVCGILPTGVAGINIVGEGGTEKQEG
jgi:hypothetical protein